MIDEKDIKKKLLQEVVGMNRLESNQPRRSMHAKGAITVLVILVISLILQACSPAGTGLTEGDQAPEFSLPSSSGTQVALDDVNRGKPVLLYFHMALG